MALGRLQNELVETSRLAMKQHAKIHNPAVPVYLTLLWLQDPSCLRWLKSYEQELQTIPSRFVTTEAAQNAWGLLWNHFKRRVLTHWKQYTKTVKKFKSCLRTVRLRNAFRNWSVNSKQKGEFCERMDTFCKQVAGKAQKIALKQWLEAVKKVQTIRKQAAVISQNHEQIQKKACWGVWKIALLERGKENVANEFYETRIRKAAMKALKIYTRVRKAKATNKSMSVIHNYENLLRKAMGGWHFLAVYHQSLRRGYKTLKSKMDRKTVSEVFQKWAAESRMEHKATVSHNARLQSKVLIGLQKWTEYHNLKEKLIENCDEKREFNLLLKGFQGLRNVTSHSRNLRSLERFQKRKLKEKRLCQTFEALRDFSVKSAKRREGRVVAQRTAQSRLLFKAVRVLSAYTKVKLMRKQTAEMIRLNAGRGLAKGVIRAWKEWLEGKKKLRENFRVIGIKKLIKLSRTALKVWRYKYQKRHKKEQSFIFGKETRLKIQIIQKWAEITKRQRVFKQKFSIFLQHRAFSLLRKAVTGFKAYSENGVLQKTHKKIAAIFFLDRKLRKILAVMKYFANMRKIENFLHERRDLEKKAKIFGHWRTAFTEAYKLKSFIVRRVQRIMCGYLRKWIVAVKRKNALEKVLGRYYKHLKVKCWKKWKVRGRAKKTFSHP